MTLTCPVCETPNEETRCRQCSTDLAPLARVTDLPLQYQREGERLLQSGEVDSALEMLSAAASLAPESVEAQVLLARAYAKKGLHAEALSHCETASGITAGRSDIADLRREIESTSAPKAPVSVADGGGGIGRSGWLLAAAALALGLLLFIPVSAVAKKIFGGEPTVARVDRVRQSLGAVDATKSLNLTVTERDGVVHVAGVAPDELRASLVRDLARESAGPAVDVSGVTVAAVAPSQRTYTVRSGDSLWSIARDVYGNAEIWREIRKANPQKLRMRIGDTLVLPEITFHPKESQ